MLLIYNSHSQAVGKWIAALLLLLGVQTNSLAVSGDDAAYAVVDRLHNTLLGVMRSADELGYAGRLERLAPVIDASFDFPTIARIVIGRYWKQLDEEQRARFLETFSKLSKATYAARFDGFGGESFRYVGAEPQKRDHMLVKTEFVKQNGEKIAFSYRVRPTENGEWLIINVIADGVSDLSLKRSDYSAVIRDQGFDELVARLNDKIAAYQSRALGD